VSRTVHRCRHCRSEKGRPHKPFCRTIKDTNTNVTDIYVSGIESGSGGGCSDTSSDCGGSGGGGGE
jgi:hypothetical protein